MGDDIRATREHTILKTRRAQLERNLSVDQGGQEYIDSRLSKFPSESTLSWEGSATTGVAARKDRCFLINYASRIVTKIVQMIFAQTIGREGVDDEFRQDATKTGLSIDAFMKSVARGVIVGQWGWIQADRGSPDIDQATGRPGVRSIADRRKAGDRIFYTFWDSTEVVDWSFDAAGDLLWLMTQETVFDNADPNAQAVDKLIRTLWQPGGGTRLELNPDLTGEVLSSTDFEISANIVPFVPIGIPSPKPFGFDNVEQVQASLLNLESAHHENLIRGVFPQLVLPVSVVDEVMQKADKTFDEAIELVRGIEYPLLEGDTSKDITRIITPATQSLEPIPAEITRRRGELFEIAGQALMKDTKQVESADAKAWNNRDVEATLADHAETLEEAETKAIATARELDTSFPDYAPTYSRKFDLPDVESDMATILDLETSGGLTPTMIKEIARTKLKILQRIVHLDAAIVEAINEEIDTMDAGALEAMAGITTGPGGPQGDEDEDEGALDEG